MIRTYDRLGHCLCLWHGLSDLVIFFFFRWQHLYLLSLYQLSSIRTRNHMLLLGRLMESVGERAWSATTGQHIRLTSEHNFGSYFRALFGRNFKGLSRACFRIFVVNLLFVTKFLTLLSCFPVVSNRYQSDREVYWCDVTTFVVCWLMFVMAVVISSVWHTVMISQNCPNSIGMRFGMLFWTIWCLALTVKNVDLCLSHHLRLQCHPPCRQRRCRHS